MIEINGILLPSIPYKIKTFVGVLLFTQYPTTIIFSDEQGNPIIKEWVDCSDDSKIDRFFFYKTNKIYLKQFIEGGISHLNLINYSLESYVIFQDIQEEQVLNTCLISLNSIPLKYKPSTDFFFNYNDGVDVIEVVEHFNLDNINVPESVLGQVKDISLKNSSETIYIKLNRGRGIGYGTINTEVLGKTLMGFDRLYKSLALDAILGNSRGDLNLDTKKNEQYLPFTETELYENRIAASYGFLIKPILPPQLELFDGETQSQKIALSVFSLINKSKETETLKKEYILHSGFTIHSYKQFLEGIIKAHLNMELNWFSPFNRSEAMGSIDYIKASKIINDIDNLSITESSEFKIRGKFRAANCDTGHYNLTSLNNEQYSGYFDKSIREGVVSINFIDIYEIIISRKMITEIGKKDDKVIDTITTFYLDT